MDRRLGGVMLVLAFLPGVGCVEEFGDGDDGESIGETSEPVEVEEPCLDCNNQSWSCECKPFNGSLPTGGYFCWSGPQFLVDSACDVLCTHLQVPYQVTVKELACSVSSPDLDCTSWDPTSAVGYSSRSGLHELDWAFVSDLVADPEPLWGCDGATVLMLEDGGFEVQDASEYDLLHALGLRDGDIILSLNGYDLIDLDDVVLVFSTLWLGQGATDYTLEIERSSRKLQLHYVLTGSPTGSEG